MSAENTTNTGAQEAENAEKYAVEVKNVTKIYRLYDKPIDRLKESLSVSHKEYHKDFYALSDLSFTVEKGQTVGIIGTNGSGKSTILKIITGVLTPTTGEVTVRGKISALLELGAGFNQDYTGIENIYMNGTMMGYTKKEMDAKLPEILDFAEIGDFVYQPVKTYSSGMFVRLAFALAINVEPEILIVDEALSVGDVFFQSKCYRRMEEIRQKGTTILMVTHDMGSIIKYCDKVVLLNKGNFVAEGAPGHMVDLYKKILAGQMEGLEAAKDVAAEFINGRPNDNIGITLFAGESFTQCPLTVDHAVLLNLFQGIQCDIIEDGTAVGMGIANAVTRLKDSKAKSKVIILLTDGTNNKGDISPLTAAEIAKSFGIRVYTIGVGTNGMAPYPYPVGNTVQYVNLPVEIDEKTLTQIAATTEGNYFRATSNSKLKEVYEEIDKLEKTKLNVKEYSKRQEEYRWFALAAFLCVLLEVLLRNSILKKIP